MGKPSRGVIAVGRLSTDRDRTTSADSAPNADGTALLAAVGAWLVGVDAAVCAVIAPEFPTELIVEITRAGIDLSRVRPVARQDASSQADMDPVPEQLASLSPRWSVHLCGLSPGRQREIIRAVRERVASITLDIDLAGAVEPKVNEILALAADCDAFLLGRKEAARLWPGEPPREVLRTMARRGVRAAVIKLGAGGSIGIRDGAITWMPAFPVSASGTMGGGDAYAGAFAAMFAADRDQTRAMAWATSAASVMVESFVALGQVTEFGRNKVDYRARMLEAEAKARNG